VATVILAVAVPAIAQDRGEEPEIMRKDRDFETSSRELRRISERNPKVAPAPKSAELMSQARTDFRAIQVANKDLKRVGTDSAPLDLKLVSSSATEVRTHAESLNTILPLPKRDKTAERVKPVAAADEAQLKTSMLTLSQLIQAFISNPCFKESALPNNELTRKARLDLENIIELSKQLEKDGQTFQKQAPKN
jgi:hypothetical protein